VLQIGAFENGTQVGEWRRYHENGALMDSGIYADGKRTGEWKTYDADGNLTRTRNHRPKRRA
jgi:antitoxin component YwqK of YwqJK toxin-antitoxin module